MKKRNTTKRKKRYTWPVLGVVFLLYFGLSAYHKHRAKRDFELQCAYYYCYMRIKELDEQRNGPEMQYYYDVAKGFEQRISDRQGMEEASKKLEAIYWNYER
ncbi:MAG: hypothetical protein AAFP77_16275 [Bacteroidota bacterium]